MSANEPSATPGAPIRLEYISELDHKDLAGANGGSILLALVGGLIAATVGALIALLFVAGQLQLLTLAFVAQGVLVGGSLAWCFKRFNVRGRGAAISLGLACGIAGVVIFHFGLYLRNVQSWHESLTHPFAAVSASKTPNPETLRWALDHPFASFDQFVIYPRSRHHGFVGYSILRIPKLWGLALLQVGMVTLIAVRMGKRAALTLFCQSCNSWYSKPVTLFALPTAMADEIAIAVQHDDIAGVIAARRVKPPPATNYAYVRLHACPRCQARVVDVTVRGSHRADVTRLSPRRVSNEMEAALRYGRAKIIDTIDTIDTAVADTPSQDVV